MTNILEAIYNIANHQDFEIKSLYSGRNRTNNIGEALEKYIKDAFAGTLGVTDELQRIQTFNQEFSWLGSQNNPPDIMIKGGDAIEVKKTQSANTSLALNSSYPKTDLRSTSPMITKECKECEDWTVKDLIYCVGHTTDTNVKSLWMVYGNSYAAKHETYQRIKTTISEGIETIPDYVFAKDYELMSITDLGNFINTNKHLPNMPTAKKVKKDGVGVGELQIKLVEKVEELTLYIIQLEQRIKEIEKK